MAVHNILEDDITFDELNSLDINNNSRKLIENNKWYPYDGANEIFKEFAILWNKSIYSKDDRGWIKFLHGDYNSGKTRLLKRFIAIAYKKGWFKGNNYRIVKYDIPNNTNSAVQFLQSILEDVFKKPIPTRLIREYGANATHKLTKMLIDNLREKQVRLLILDEMQRLLKAKTNDINKVFELFKDILNGETWGKRERPRLILCGTSEGVSLLSSDSWIQDRAEEIELKPLQLPYDPNEENDFIELLFTIHEDFSNNYGLVDWDIVLPDGGINNEHAQILFAHSEGKVGRLIQILRDAGTRALNNNQTFISIPDYTKALSQGFDFEFDEEGTLHKLEKDEGIKEEIIKLDLQNLVCVKCGKSYKKPYYLRQHYKKKHKLEVD